MVHGIVHIIHIQTRQAQLGLRARQQLLVPKLIIPALTMASGCILNTAPSTSGVLAPAAQNVAARAMALGRVPRILGVDRAFAKSRGHRRQAGDSTDGVDRCAPIAASVSRRTRP